MKSWSPELMGDSFPSTLVSIVPFGIEEVKPGLTPSRFIIPASEDGEPKTLKINGCLHFVYIDEDRGSMPVRTPSNELASSIVRDYLGSQLEARLEAECYPGLAWIPGDVSVVEVKLKHKDVLDLLRRCQGNWFEALVRLADDDWEKNRQHMTISDTQRFAARALGQERPWIINIPVSEGDIPRCPACMSQVNTKAIICAVCKMVLNVEEYKKKTFAVA